MECQRARADGKPCQSGSITECDHCFNRCHAVAALTALAEMEQSLVVLYEYAGIGTERPPEHVFEFFRRMFPEGAVEIEAGES